MKHPEHLSEEWKNLASSLADDSLAAVDFDRIRDALRSAAAHVAQMETMKQELARLRSHIEDRLAGMLKAVAVTAPGRHRREEALALAEGLGDMSGEQLLTCYKRSSAIFRDCFPTTFAPPTDRSLRQRNVSDLNDFK